MFLKKYEMGKSYFENRVQKAEPKDKPKMMMKLAEALQKCGKYQEAEEMTESALAMFQEAADTEDR